MRGDPQTSRRYESRVEEQIRKAVESGQFDDLPGAGKPLDLPAAQDENWWIRSKLRAEGVSNDALLPASLQLRKEIDRLDDAVRDLRDEDAVREVVADLDRRIVSYLRAPSGPAVPVRRPSADAVVARWREARAAARRARSTAARAAPSPPAGSRPQQDRRRPWWRRVGQRARLLGPTPGTGRTTGPTPGDT